MGIKIWPQNPIDWHLHLHQPHWQSVLHQLDSFCKRLPDPTQNYHHSYATQFRHTTWYTRFPFPHRHPSNSNLNGHCNWDLESHWLGSCICLQDISHRFWYPWRASSPHIKSLYDAPIRQSPNFANLVLLSFALKHCTPNWKNLQPHIF